MNDPLQNKTLAELSSLIRLRVRQFAAESRRSADVRQLEIVRSSYDEEELLEVIDVLLEDRLSEDRLTMGRRVADFESRWSEFLPVPFSIMVNSGSSANLLAFSALSSVEVENHLQPGNEVIIPALAWSTSLFPIAQMGCVPVLVDVDPKTLNVDPEQVIRAITPRTRALMVVHLLGNPCDMTRLIEIARQHNLFVVEDCCEAHGASINDQRVGTFGDLSTFSLFFSHHITAIEGGIICGLDQARWRDRLISMRAHGWSRGRSDHDDWVRRYPDIDPRWLFVTTGYNLRPTELNAAFANVQLSKLDGFLARRIATRKRLMKHLRQYEEYFVFQESLPGHQHVAFALPFIVREGAPFSRKEFQSHLESCRIQTRPIVGSNLARQPVMRHIQHRALELPNADQAHFNGVMVSNHHHVTEAQQDYLLECCDQFIRRFR